MEQLLFNWLNQYGILLYRDKNQVLQLEYLDIDASLISEILQASIEIPARLYHFTKKVVLRTFFPNMYRKMIIKTLQRYNFDWMVYAVAMELKNIYLHNDPYNELNNDKPDKNGEFKTSAENRIREFKKHLYLAKTGVIYSIRKYPDLPLEYIRKESGNCRAFLIYTGIRLIHLNVQYDKRIGIELELPKEPDIPEWAIQDLKLLERFD